MCEDHQIGNIIKIQMEVVGVQGIVFEGESSFVGWYSKKLSDVLMEEAKFGKITRAENL